MHDYIQFEPGGEDLKRLRVSEVALCKNEGVGLVLKFLCEQVRVGSYLRVDDRVAVLERMGEGDSSEKICERLYLVPGAFGKELWVNHHHRLLVVRQLAQVSHPHLIYPDFVLLTVPLVLYPGL